MRVHSIQLSYWQLLAFDPNDSNDPNDPNGSNNPNGVS